MGKKERRGKKKWAMIRVTEEVRRRLEAYKTQTEDSYSGVILKNIEPPKDIWKNKLQEGFEKLEQDFPGKEGIFEYMRIIIFKSESLPKELEQKYDEEVKLRLNEISNYDLEECCLKKDTEEREREREVSMGNRNHAVTDEDDGFDRYTYIKKLPGPEPGSCDNCESDEVYWVADCEGGRTEYLCYECGLRIKEHLEENGGVLEIERFNVRKSSCLHALR